MMQSIVGQVVGLEAPVTKKVAPILAQAQAELEKELKVWLAKEDGDARFTTQKLRSALVQVRTALETIKETHPALVEGLRIGSRTAGQLATNLTEEEILRFGHLFDGDLRMMDVDRGAVIAKGDRMVFSRFESSAKRYAGNVRKSVIQELAVGAMRGETMHELGRRLERNMPGVFSKASRSADRLARTETMNAFNTYHHESIKELVDEDDEIRMRWDATADVRKCYQCASLHGKVVKVDKEFKTSWRNMRADGSLTKLRRSSSEHPPAHPNCRCVIVAWHKDWEMDAPADESVEALDRAAGQTKEHYGQVWLPGEDEGMRKRRLMREQSDRYRAKKAGRPIPIITPVEGVPPPPGFKAKKPRKAKPAAPPPKPAPKPKPAPPKPGVRPAWQKREHYGDVWLPGETKVERKKRLMREQSDRYRAKKKGLPPAVVSAAPPGSTPGKKAKVPVPTAPKPEPKKVIEARKRTEELKRKKAEAEKRAAEARSKRKELEKAAPKLRKGINEKAMAKRLDRVREIDAEINEINKARAKLPTLDSKVTSGKFKGNTLGELNGMLWAAEDNRAVETKKFRKELRKVIPELGVRKRPIQGNMYGDKDTDGLNVESKRKAGNFRGTYNMATGRMTLREDVVREAAKFKNRVAKGDKQALSAEAEAMRTVVHEQLHGAGPTIISARRGSGYQKSGTVIEEVTTELTARRYMRERYAGMKVVSWKAKSMEEAYSPWPGSEGSYQDYIDATAKSIAQTYGIKMGDAYDLLDEASFTFKQSKAKTQTISSMETQFIKAIEQAAEEKLGIFPGKLRTKDRGKIRKDLAAATRKK